MNILFLMKSLGGGGVETVTAVLANKFVAEGHGVCAFAFCKSKIPPHFFDPRIRLYERDGLKADRGNVEALRKALTENKVDVIINQWGLPLVPIRTALKARRGMDVKIVSVYHNAPSFNARTQGMTIKLQGCGNPLRAWVLRAVRRLFREVTSRAMRYNYDMSDRFLVLSESFVDEFKQFTGIKDGAKLRVMTNPVTIGSEGYEYDQDGKEKEIIYVGRLDFVQKRVHRVIDTWNLLEERFPDWRLTVVGEGADRTALERHVEALGLKRVRFEGFQNPLPYYKRAQLLMLTSDFEGFGLVIVEGMRFGVVPAVYRSYSAVDDIISDGTDGIVLPFFPRGFSAEDAASRLARLMSRPQLLRRMATAAVEKSRRFSLDSIYGRWMQLLGEVTASSQ